MLQTNSKEIIRHLKTMRIKNNSLIFLHIDVKGLGILKNGLDEIYQAFNQILSKGVLVTPAFTYSWSKKKNLPSYPNVIIKRSEFLLIFF